MNPSAPQRLEGALTIVACQDQREALLALVHASEAGLVLDLSAVSACDSAGLQLLLAARKTLAARGAVLSLQAASPVVVEALMTYGLEALLSSADPEGHRDDQ